MRNNTQKAGSGPAVIILGGGRAMSKEEMLVSAIDELIEIVRDLSHVALESSNNAVGCILKIKKLREEWGNSEKQGR